MQRLSECAKNISTAGSSNHFHNSFNVIGLQLQSCPHRWNCLLQDFITVPLVPENDKYKLQGLLVLSKRKLTANYNHCSPCSWESLLNIIKLLFFSSQWWLLSLFLVKLTGNYNYCWSYSWERLLQIIKTVSLVPKKAYYKLRWLLFCSKQSLLRIILTVVLIPQKD